MRKVKKERGIWGTTELGQGREVEG